MQKQNLTGTEHVIRGLRSGQKYLVVITGYQKSQPKVTYTGTFSTSKYLLRKTHKHLFFHKMDTKKMGKKPCKGQGISWCQRSQPWRCSVVSLEFWHPPVQQQDPVMKRCECVSLANASWHFSGAKLTQIVGELKPVPEGRLSYCACRRLCTMGLGGVQSALL